MTTSDTADGGSLKFAMTIDEFCKAHGGICRASFYNLLRNGKAPATMKVGARVMISVEAAAEWRRAMEARGDRNRDLSSTAA